MSIQEAVKLAIGGLSDGKLSPEEFAAMSNRKADAAITAFLEAAAKAGWRMRPDEPMGEMADYPTARVIWREMSAAAPKFELDK